MGFNRRKLEEQRRTAAESEAASRRATDAQVRGIACRRRGTMLCQDDQGRVYDATVGPR
jgi:hypothetical protein